MPLGSVPYVSIIITFTSILILCCLIWVFVGVSGRL